MSANNFHPAMSFKEIAKEIGVTPKYAQLIYKRALYKLRNRQPGALLRLLELFRERQRILDGM